MEHHRIQQNWHACITILRRCKVHLRFKCERSTSNQGYQQRVLLGRGDQRTNSPRLYHREEDTSITCRQPSNCISGVNCSSDRGNSLINCSCKLHRQHFDFRGTQCTLGNGQLPTDYCPLSLDQCLNASKLPAGFHHCRQDCNL